MALTAFLKLKGSKMGDIKGSVVQKGREGKIAVLASNHELAAGPEAGKALLHQPFVLLKAVDQSTPLLYQALVSGEVFSECEIQYWTPKKSAGAGAGLEVNHYTVKLIGARLQQIAFVQPSVLDPALASHPETETLSLVYDSIEWRWILGNLSATATQKAARKKRA